jgi:hypothetical protein
MVVGIDSQCTCGQNLGVHCGDRVKDGYLEGSCELSRIYECLVENNTANEGGICTHCIKGQSPGTDKCLTENERKLLSNRIFLSFIIEIFLF